MAEEQQANAFDIRKIYLKDSSLESPNSPGVFLKDPSKPDIAIEASIRAAGLEQESFYEVILGLTVTSKIGDDIAFLVEVHQAGIFQIIGLAEADLPLALEIACPNVLLPFAREAVSDLVGKAGFPQLLLSPINFEALYNAKQQQQAKAAAADGSDSGIKHNLSEQADTSSDSDKTAH